MARCIGAKGDALREVWVIDPLQWAHRERSPAVRVLRGDPASHPTPNQVQAYHLPDAFRGDHPGGPDLWGWGNRCHLSRLSIVVPADSPFVHRRLHPQEVEGEPSALLAVPLDWHPSGGRFLMRPLRHRIQDKGLDEPRACGARGHGAPFLSRLVTDSNPRSIGRSCRAGGSARTREEPSREIGAAQGHYLESRKKEKIERWRHGRESNRQLINGVRSKVLHENKT